MSLPSSNTGSMNEALALNVHLEINNQLHNGFIVRYSSEPKEFIIDSITNISMNSLQSTQTFEVWQGVVQHGTALNDWQMHQNDQYLIASVPHALLQHLPIEQATEKAYSTIIEQIEQWGYPYLIRTWNFFPDITSNQFGANNNYQLFCSGRTRAYAAHSLVSQPYPAATVIGTQQQDLHVHFIASKTSGIGIENTKQVSAFEYPSSYSEDPPLFSRALLHRNQSQQILFISGTASITGHNTQFEGDINRQTEVCLDNIQHLLNTAVHEYQFTNISLSDLSQLKVFIKYPEHLDTVKTHIEGLIGIQTPIVYLQGDMCRSDLLIEIEALAIIPSI